jgi:Ca2+-binding EF-hand superfamily protein
LLGIVKKLGAGSDLGKVNKALKDLNEKAEEFLKIYDKDNNGEIDTSELIEKRAELTQDLAKDKKESKS